MKTEHFQQQLAWAMLNAQYLGLIFEQNQAGRPLTQNEIELSMGRSHDMADTLTGFLDGTRRKALTPVRRFGRLRA